MEYNEHVGITFEECCKKYEYLINDVVNKNKFRVKNCSSINFEDVRQIAIVGLVKAYETYSKKHKKKFKYYAYDRMRWEILDTLKASRSTVSFPQSFCIIWSIASKRGVTSMKQIDTVIKHKPANISESQVKRAMEWYGHDSPLSLDKPFENKKNGNGNPCYDTIKGYDNDETVIIVNDFLKFLTTKQRQVVAHLMDEKAQSEIAEIMNISQQQVSRIVKSIREAWIKYEGSGD